MKTAISIPDDVFADGERLARRLGKSRSQLYAEAISEYIARRQPEAAAEALDAALEGIDQTEAREWARRTSRRAVGRAEWK